MIEQHLRPIFQSYLFDPINAQLNSLNAKPWHLSILGGAFGILAAIFVAMNTAPAAIFFLLLSGLCDTLDGGLARLQNAQTEFGCVLDIMIDRLVESAFVIGLYLQRPTPRALPSLLLMASILLCVTSFLVVSLFDSKNTASNKSFHYSPGLIERAECFIFFVTMALWTTQFTVLSVVLSILIIYTAARRIIEFAINQ